MKKLILLSLYLTLLFSIPILSQSFTHQFTQTAHIDHGGEACGVAVSLDGTIFLANGEDGIRAYLYNGTLLTNTAHINSGGFAYSITVSSDGTIFLANGEDGLRGYSYNGGSFTNTAHIDDGGLALDVTVDSNGTVFLVSEEDGLRAYSYDGNSFINTAHIFDNDYPGGVTVGDNGVIFLANGFDGIRAYTYDGSSFNNTAHHILVGGFVSDIVLHAYGTIFSCSKGGRNRRFINAYSLNDTSFIELAEYSYSGRGTPSGTVLFDGTIIVVNSRLNNDISAYIFDGSSFFRTAMAETSVPGMSQDVTAAQDGTIFFANGEGGLIAYEYSPITSVEENTLPAKFELSQNYPNPFNPSTKINYVIPSLPAGKAGGVSGGMPSAEGLTTLKVYNVLGKEMATLVNEVKEPGAYKVNFKAANLPSGVYFYKLRAGKYTATKKMLLLK